jgi:hypothetical protein
MPKAEEEPPDAVGAGKTVERTPEPGADVVRAEEETAAADAVAAGGGAAPGVAGVEGFAMAGSVETDVSMVSASEARGSNASAALIFA